MNLTNTMIAAAVGGILMGCGWLARRRPRSRSLGDGAGGRAPPRRRPAKHACKGQNACKGQGGCKTDKHACKGQNDCKGQGGCKG